VESVIYRKCVTIKICLTAVSPSKLYFLMNQNFKVDMYGICVST